jgi:hypothetical protein
MNLTELQQEVYTLTNRPDLVAQTLLAVRSATLKIHQADYFFKDIFETGISFSPAAYIQQIEYRTLLPRWRAFQYLRKTNSTGAEQGKFIDLIVPENVLDEYQINRTDVCYVAGQVIQIKSSTELQYAILGCYLNPDITVSNYDSWVALDHPYAIVFEAAASVFKMIGDTDQFAAYSTLATQQLVEVRNSNISAKGE